MRSALFLAAIAPALVAAAPLDVDVAAPPTAPKITSLEYAGNGCAPKGSVKSSSTTIGDSATFTFSEFRGDDTNNCGIHLQAQGGSSGWQVAIKDVEYKGSVNLKPGSTLDTTSQVFWSEAAAKTVSTTLYSRTTPNAYTSQQSGYSADIVCKDEGLKDSFTVKHGGDLNWSKCTGNDGYPGTLNVNFRPVVKGNGGSYDIKSATWRFVWRRC
jgi:hypothetical protein